MRQALSRLTCELGRPDADQLAGYCLTSSCSYPGPTGQLNFWASAEPIMTAARCLARFGAVLSGGAAADLIAP